MPYKRIVLLTFASAMTALFASGCGTIRGFGRDVETVGGTIEETAR